MTPIVYAKDDLQRNSNGLGRLTDCIECTVENNADDYSCELHIVYPVDGFHAELISYANVIGVQIEPHGNIQLFDVYKINQNESGNMVVDAHHVRLRMKYIPTTFVYGKNIVDIIRSLNMVNIGAQMGDYGSYSPEGGTKNFCFHNPFTFWTNITQASVFYQITYIRQTTSGNVRFYADLDYKYSMVTSTDISKSFWDVLFDKDGFVTVYGLSVKFDNFDVYISEPDALVTDKSDEIIIRYGKDIKEFSIELNSSDFELYTHAIPYIRRTIHTGGDDGDVDVCQFFMSDPDDKTSDPLYMEIPYKPLEVSGKRYLPVDLSESQFALWDNFIAVSDSGHSGTVLPSVLASETIQKAMKVNAEKVSPTFEIGMSALRESSMYTDYQSIEHIRLNDIVSVALEPAELVIKEQALKTEYNVLAEVYDQITIGTLKANVADILSALAEHEENTETTSNTYLDYSEKLTPYTTERTLSNYNDGQYAWELSYTVGQGAGSDTVESEPVRLVGNMVTANLCVVPTSSTDADITLSANVERKILAGLPVPKGEDIRFVFPTTYKDIGGGTSQTVTKQFEYHINENGDLYIKPPSAVMASNSNVADRQLIFRIQVQYITTMEAMDDSWKNYITSDNVDWKERESE